MIMAKMDTELQPWTDPIVAEVRDVRERLLAACNYDLERLAAELRERQRAGDREGVTLPPRRPSGGTD